MYYVTMTDKFMSGWGHAQKLTNKLIFECETYSEALIVEENARNRSDMNYINICARKPSYYRKNDQQVGNYYVQVKTKEEYPTWYKAGSVAR